MHICRAKRIEMNKCPVKDIRQSEKECAKAGKQKISGPVLFMYAVIFISMICAVVSFSLYYSNKTEREWVLWAGIVAFMLVYHLWGRILMGTNSKCFKWDPASPGSEKKPLKKSFTNGSG